jgi:hypothetical protein
MDERTRVAFKAAFKAGLQFIAFHNSVVQRNWQRTMAAAPPPKLTPKTTGRKQKRKRKAQASEESKQETAKKQKKEDKPKTVMLVPLGEEKAPDPPPDDVPDAPDAPQPQQATAPDSPNSRAYDILKKVMHAKAPLPVVEPVAEPVAEAAVPEEAVPEEAPVATIPEKHPQTLLEGVLKKSRELVIFNHHDANGRILYDDFDRFIVKGMGRRLGWCGCLRAMDNSGKVDWDLLRSFKLVPLRRSEAKSMYSFLDFMARGSKKDGSKKDFCTLREKIGQCFTYEPMGSKKRPMTSYEAILRHKYGRQRKDKDGELKPREFYILVKQGNRKAVIRFRKKYHLDNIEGHLPLSKARV